MQILLLCAELSLPCSVPAGWAPCCPHASIGETLPPGSRVYTLPTTCGPCVTSDSCECGYFLCVIDLYQCMLHTSYDFFQRTETLYRDKSPFGHYSVMILTGLRQTMQNGSLIAICPGKFSANILPIIPNSRPANHYAKCVITTHFSVIYAITPAKAIWASNYAIWESGKLNPLRSLVADSRGSLSAVSTTSCQQVLESSFPSPVRKHALIGPVYLIQPIETCFISSRNQNCFTKICANCGEKTHALSLIAHRWERSD